MSGALPQTADDRGQARQVGFPVSLMDPGWVAEGLDAEAGPGREAAARLNRTQGAQTTLTLGLGQVEAIEVKDETSPGLGSSTTTKRWPWRYS